MMDQRMRVVRNRADVPSASGFPRVLRPLSEDPLADLKRSALFSNGNDNMRRAAVRDLAVRLPHLFDIDALLIIAFDADSVSDRIRAVRRIHELGDRSSALITVAMFTNNDIVRKTVVDLIDSEPILKYLAGRDDLAESLKHFVSSRLTALTESSKEKTHPDFSGFNHLNSRRRAVVLRIIELIRGDHSISNLSIANKLASEFPPDRYEAPSVITTVTVSQLLTLYIYPVVRDLKQLRFNRST